MSITLTRKRKAACLAEAFLLPVSLFIVIMALCGVFPFGDRSLLLWDAEGQYISFLAAWRRVLLGQADPFYTLSRTLGGSMV